MAAAMVAFEEDAVCVWATLARLGFCASASTGRPETRPEAEGRTAALVLARELAVGARREEVRLRTLVRLPSGDLASPLELLVDAKLLVLARLFRVPIEETAAEVPDVLFRVPIDDTVLILAVWREAAVPVVVLVLLTRERAVPVAVLGRDAAIAGDLTVPEGAEGAVKGGMGDRAREVLLLAFADAAVAVDLVDATVATDFVDATVPVDFVELTVPVPFEVDAFGGGLTNLLTEPDAFRVVVVAAAASSFAFSPFLSAEPEPPTAGCAAVFGTGMLDGAAGFALLPPPMFSTLRTSDLAAPRKPNRDVLPFTVNRQSAQLRVTRSARTGQDTHLGVPQYWAVPDCSAASPSQR